MIAQYIKIARRWKWVIIAGIAAGIAAALIITLLLMGRIHIGYSKQTLAA